MRNVDAPPSTRQNSIAAMSSSGVRFNSGLLCQRFGFRLPLPPHASHVMLLKLVDDNSPVPQQTGQSSFFGLTSTSGMGRSCLAGNGVVAQPIEFSHFDGNAEQLGECHHDPNP
jgi:hypothetical protein